MMKADEFVKAFLKPEPKKLIQYAKIDPSYTTGRPRLIFDGEDVVSVKRYPYISTYTPQANDRVMLINNTVMGAIM